LPHAIVIEVAQLSRTASALILLGLGAFVALTALAAESYPGGTFCDPNARSYEFWGNFFCDLTQPVTQRGVDNRSSRLSALVSFACFSLALIPFWWKLGALLAGRLGRATLAFGLLSADGTNLIAWLPSRASPLAHQIAVFLATIPGLGAALLGVLGLFARGRLPETPKSAYFAAGVFGAFALAFGAADAAYYAYAIAFPGCHPLLPALQKIAALCVIAWMALIALTDVRTSSFRS
jgi:hypothetical protein